jgi:hypothetical protein
MRYIQTEFARDTFSIHDWRRYRRLVLFLACTLASFAIAKRAQAQQPNPQDAFQEFFDKFTNHSNTFMPGFLGELSEEQLNKLAKIEISKSSEDAFGDRVLKGFLDHCKEKKIKVVQNGKEIAYLQSLCSAVKPLMTNARRKRSYRCLLYSWWPHCGNTGLIRDCWNGGRVGGCPGTRTLALGSRPSIVDSEANENAQPIF